MTMTSLTRDEALKIAGALKLPSQPFIDGSYRAAIDGKPFKSINPATGETLAEIEGCGVADTDAAVAAAKAAFKSGAWSGLHPSARKAVLLRFAELIRKNLTEL